MFDWLSSAFAFVCGQYPEHVWAPGGWALPCCQRCTGLSVGGALAVALHLVLRLPATARWKWMHGLFLLQMVPFGYHWLPQGPVLRTETGVLFAFGVVAFLWPAFGVAKSASPPSARSTGRGSAAAYGLGLSATLICLPILALWAGRLGFVLLSLLATLGALALAGLVLWNGVVLCRHGCRAAARRWSRSRSVRLPA